MSHPPIYIINLKRSPERKLHIQRQLDALNLNYEFVEAIDKYDLKSKAYRAEIANQLDIDETDMELLYKAGFIGTVACLLSHIKAQDLVVKNNARYACILEDDAHILSTFPNMLTVAEKVPWDVLMLSSQTRYIRRILREFYCSRSFSFIHKLIRYEKYYPELNPFTARSIAIKFSQLVLERLQNKMNIKTFQKSGYYTEDQKLQRSIMHLACEIGGLPDQNRRSWNKVMRGHYICTPYKGRKTSEKYPSPFLTQSMKLSQNHFAMASAMAYMLTPSAACKWKQKAILSVKETGRLLQIDCTPFELYQKNDLSLYIVIPPCVRASYRFLVYSLQAEE